MVSWLGELERGGGGVAIKVCARGGRGGGAERSLFLSGGGEGSEGKRSGERGGVWCPGWKARGRRCARSCPQMREILSAEGLVTGPESGEGAVAEPATGPVAGVGSPVGVRLVPTWSVGLDAGVLPSSYRDIVEV